MKSIKLCACSHNLHSNSCCNAKLLRLKQVIVLDFSHDATRVETYEFLGCMPLCLQDCLSVFLFVCLSACLPACMHVSLFVCLSICLFAHHLYGRFLYSFSSGTISACWMLSAIGISSRSLQARSCWEQIMIDSPCEWDTRTFFFFFFFVIVGQRTELPSPCLVSCHNRHFLGKSSKEDYE